MQNTENIIKTTDTKQQTNKIKKHVITHAPIINLYTKETFKI